MMVMLLNQSGCDKEKECGIVTLPQEKECSYEEALKADIPSMSIEDIESLNNHNCGITYNENGKISFINGKYTDYKVTNFQEAYNSLMAVKELLSLPMEELVPVRIHTEDVGTYYTFGIMDENNYKKGWGVHVIADAKDTVQGLSVSYGDNEFGYSGITANAPNYTSNKVFEELESVETTAIDMEGNEVTITTLYDKEKDTYYLGNLERKIILVEYQEGLFDQGKGKYLERKENNWNDPKSVSILNAMIQVYDFFAEELGICSVDGSGVPIMAAVRNPHDFSGYYGIANDFACFSFTEEHIGDLAVFAHEYTHGVLESCANSFGYVNVQGTLNEGYAQVIGHIVESYLEDRKTVDWYSTQDNEAIDIEYIKNRNYNNFYTPPVEEPRALTNDFGATHLNSYLLLNYAARLEEEQGLSKEEQLKLWKTTIYFANSNECFDTMKQKLLLSAKLHNKEKWAEAVVVEYKNMKFPKDATKDAWLKNTEEGYGRLIVELDEEWALVNLKDEDENIEEIEMELSVFNETEGRGLHKNIAGNYTCLLPEGEHSILVVCEDFKGNIKGCSIKPYTITISEGETLVITELPNEYQPVSEDEIRKMYQN